MSSSGTIICLFGPSGSGKTTWKKEFVKLGYKNIKSCTTRKKRSEEDDEYDFLTSEQWNDLELHNELVNVNNYHGENYGIRLGSLALVGCGVLVSDVTSLEGVKSISKCFNKQVKFVYCAPPSIKEIKKRHAQRGTTDRIDISMQEIKVQQNSLPTGTIYLRNTTDLKRITSAVADLRSRSWQNFAF